jgi:hypothetical protein
LFDHDRTSGTVSSIVIDRRLSRPAFRALAGTLGLPLRATGALIDLAVPASAPAGEALAA